MAKKAVGRPTKYSGELANKICAQISSGMSLLRICETDDMPHMATIFRWLADDRYKKFRENYARATDERAEAVIEEAFLIADDGRNDWMERNFGKEKAWMENGEALQRSKLRVDLRKWYASKLKPKKYGDKLDLTSDGEPLPAPIAALPTKKAQQ